ncbi:hypothetical protein KHP62_17615 [Rhodobacteraceae bacterium NNCM2]|nr:hypothetical protein [Coraliihabitans acroporae]
MTPEFKSRLEDKANVSNRISETVRYIGFGLVAVFYTIRNTDNEVFSNLPQDYFYLFISIGFFGALTLVFDYFQYLAGYFSVNDALRREQEKFAYNTATRAYRLRTVFFWAKQIAAGLGSGALVASIVVNLWR